MLKKSSFEDFIFGSELLHFAHKFLNFILIAFENPLHSDLHIVKVLWYLSLCRVNLRNIDTKGINRVAVVFYEHIHLIYIDRSLKLALL